MTHDFSGQADFAAVAMSHVISSSDSEEDRHGASKTLRKSHEQCKRVSKYECPADFVSYEYSSSASILPDSSDHTELWLIRAPARFDPENLAGLKMSLSSLEMIQSTAGTTPQIYSVLGSNTGPTDLHLLTSSCMNQNVSLSASAFTGVLSISESYGDCSGNQGPIAIPAAPAPSIPPGLRQHFQPFGNFTPTHTAKRANLHLAEGEGQGKKKKKKKKEKHSREGNTEEVHIKQEEISCVCDDRQTSEPVGEETTVDRSKKKKEKKSKGRQDTSAIAKQEPIDTSYGDIDTPVKKKKKKKTLDE